jgi:hypothetical protein
VSFGELATEAEGRRLLNVVSFRESVAEAEGSKEVAGRKEEEAALCALEN